MPIPLDSRKKPADVQIHLSSGAGVDIAWSDGHMSHYDFSYLRDWCPCATCNDERMKKDAARRAATVSGSGPTAELPIFKPKARAQAARAVGHYALQIEFTDGHSTGIFSFAYLRKICPCPACAADFRP